MAYYKLPPTPPPSSGSDDSDDEIDPLEIQRQLDELMTEINNLWTELKDTERRIRRMMCSRPGRGWTRQSHEILIALRSQKERYQSVITRINYLQSLLNPD